MTGALIALAVYALLLVAWGRPWSSTSTADADEASAVESSDPVEEALWARA